YHSVMPEPEKAATTLGGIIHSAQLFRHQMDTLARHYNPVNLDDVLLFVEGKKRLPHRAVVVTFDDGYADNVEFAAPILKQVGVPATFYATVDCLDRATSRWDTRLRFAFQPTEKLSWSGLNGTRWQLSGVGACEQAF